MKSCNLKNERYLGADQKPSLYDLTIPENWNNEIILFIHGYMGYKDWGCWNLVSDFFTQEDFGFLKYNVSHNGTTIDNQTEFLDLSSFAENNYAKELADFDAIIDLIKSNFTVLPKIHLIGHSRGGGIALLQAKNTDISKIISWAAISNIEERFPKNEMFEEWKNKGVYYRLNGRTNQEMPHNFSQYESFLENKERLDIEAHCRNKSTEILCIHGDKDEAVSINDGKLISTWIASDLSIIKDANHTFGSTEPWLYNELPEQLLQACEKTKEFILSVSEEDEKLSLLSDLVKLAKSDDNVREMEFQFLLSIASQLGVSKSDFLQIFDRFIAYNPPKLEADRILQLQRLILLMNVDSNISEKEIEYIKEAGMKMGLHPEAVAEVLRVMNDYPNRIIPPDNLIQIFKVYHN
jgi:uncharacterized tellurite resistance protein B-like protein/alpha/beta superfamily hydrolase